MSQLSDKAVNSDLDARPCNSMRTDVSDRRLMLIGILLSTLALAYFYVADNYFFSTAKMSRIFQHLLMVDDAKTAWLTLSISLLAAFWKKPSIFIAAIDFVGSRILIVALLSVVLFALGAVAIYHNTAFSMDEYAAVFQAKIFAAGRLTAQLPASAVPWIVPAGFNGAFLVASRATGQAMEAYWPGFSLLLAPFELLGVPWLCNAVLAGVAVVLVHHITQEITGDKRASGWAVVFTLASGAFAANAISYYSMQAHLTANLVFVWLLLKPNRSRAFCAGLVGSVALILHNPFPHAMFAMPWIVAIFRSSDRRHLLLPLTVGYLPLLVLVGFGWLQLREVVTSGDSGFNVIGNNLVAVFRLPDKSMLDARVASIVKMWIWSVPCIFLLAIHGRIRMGEDPRIRLMAQSAILTLLGYVFFAFDQGHGWGNRYFHSAWGVIPILAACALPRSNGRLMAFAGALAAMNLIIIIPFQLNQVERIISSHSAQMPAPHRPGNNVYFINGSRGFYLLDLVQTDPFLRTPDLALVSRGFTLDAELRRQNWPKAVLVERTLGVEEWNLGPRDIRQNEATVSGKVFAFGYTDLTSKTDPALKHQ